MVSHRYLATFAPGFEDVIGAMLARAIPRAVISNISSGMILFDAEETFDTVVSPPFFNNVFLVLREWKTNGTPFPAMVRAVAGVKFSADVKAAVRAGEGDSFRVRYSRANQFCSVDKTVMAEAERNISAQTGLRADRMNSEREFWFLARSEPYSCFAARLTRKQSTEKYLEKGELRPEIAQLIAGLARACSDDKVVCDPFAGHGALPAQLAELCPDSRVLASDIDSALVKKLRARFGGVPNVEVRECDALRLTHVADGSVDLVVTDPPWGFWDGDSYRGDRSIESLYRGMLAEFARILRAGGRAFVLTGAKSEFENAARASETFSPCVDADRFRTDILVNGKKSAVYALKKR
jgi:predicted RNA methylase